MRPKIRKSLFLTQKLVYTELVLESRKACKVHVFGEFSRSPWRDKIKCTASQGHWKVGVYIKLGHMFKFCVDEGSYVLSHRYLTRKDGLGNCNNVF